MSEKKKKNGFHQPENSFPLTVMEYSFKSKFPLDRKIKIPVAAESEKVISISQKISFHQQEQDFFFKNYISPIVSTSRKKSLNKIILFQIARKSVPISVNGERRIHLRIPFQQPEKLLTLTGISEKVNEMIANSNNKSFKQASL